MRTFDENFIETLIIKNNDETMLKIFNIIEN